MLLRKVAGCGPPPRLLHGGEALQALLRTPDANEEEGRLGWDSVKLRAFGSVEIVEGQSMPWLPSVRMVARLFWMSRRRLP